MIALRVPDTLGMICVMHMLQKRERYKTHSCLFAIISRITFPFVTCVSLLLHIFHGRHSLLISEKRNYKSAINKGCKPVVNLTNPQTPPIDCFNTCSNWLCWDAVDMRPQLLGNFSKVATVLKRRGNPDLKYTIIHNNTNLPRILAH